MQLCFTSTILIVKVTLSVKFRTKKERLGGVALFLSGKVILKHKQLPSESQNSTKKIIAVHLYFLF